MTNFDHILNWKLNAGSHEFPGPNGGTCINEAAIVAAGFPYQAVNSAEDMPPCFSRVIAQYALALNDFMPDSQRQQLMPYVVRLAGTADTPAVERQRAEYLAMQAVTVFAARALDVAQLPDHATACRAARDLKDAAKAAKAVGAAGAAASAASAALSAKAVGAAGAAASAAASAARAAVWAARAALWAARAEVAEQEAWGDAIAALDGALAIGRQSDPIVMPLAVERLDRAKAEAAG